MKKTAILFVLAAMIGCNNADNKEAANTPKADSAAATATAKARWAGPGA